MLVYQVSSHIKGMWLPYYSTPPDAVRLFQILGDMSRPTAMEDNVARHSYLNLFFDDECYSTKSPLSI